MCIPKIGNGLRVWHSIWLAGKAPLACSYQHSNLPGPTRLSCVKANSIHGPLLQGLHLHWRLLSTYTPIEEIPALIRTTLATSLVPYPPIAALCIVAYTPFARTKPRKLIVLDALESGSGPRLPKPSAEEIGLVIISGLSTMTLFAR